MKKNRIRTKKKSFKIIKGKEEEKLTSHIEKKFKEKNFRSKIDHILKKRGIVALPLIYKSIIESQLSGMDGQRQLNEPDVFQDIKNTLYNQARRNSLI